MHHFFLQDTKIQINHPIDLAPLVHQLHTVLRLGQAFTVELIELSRKEATGNVLDAQPVQGEPPIPLTLYQCTLKADKFEWVLQKGTELGVTRFVPIISQRSIVRPASALLKKYDRWQTIIREAAEQCRRGRLPTLEEPLTWDRAVASAQGERFLAWEESEHSSRLGLALAQQSQCKQAINLLVGPEGGLTAEEMASASALGWQVVSLGPRILRAETAALAAVTVVMSQMGEL